MKNKIIYFGIAFLATINIYAQTYFKEGYFVDNQNKKVECLIKYQRWSETPVSFDYKLKEDSPLQTKNVEEVNEFKIYKTAKYYKRYKLDVNVFDKELNLIKKKGDLIFLKVLFEAEKSLLAYEDIQNIFFYEHNNELLLLKYAEKKSLSAKHREFQKQLYENLFCEGFTVKKYSRVKYEKNDLVTFFEEYANCKNQSSENFYEKRTKVKVNFQVLVGSIFTPKSFNKTNYNLNGSEVVLTRSNLNDQITYTAGFETEFTFSNGIDKWRLFLAPNFQYFNSNDVVVYNLGGRFDLSEPFKSSLEVLGLEIPVGIRRYFKLNKNFNVFVSTSYAYNLFLEGETTLRTAPERNYDWNSRNGSFTLGIGGSYKKKYSFAFNYYFSRNIIALNNKVSVDAGDSIGLTFGYQLF